MKAEAESKASQEAGLGAVEAVRSAVEAQEAAPRFMKRR